ncbi:MAG: peptide ABC transporter substrate-binding protein [Bradymonadia bacterium]
MLCLIGCSDKGGQAPAHRASKKTDAQTQSTLNTKAVAGPTRRERDPRVFHRSLSEPDTLDPALILSTEGATIAFDTFEGLYINAADHTTWQPGAALRHEISKDGLVWTFHLRENGRWSDGTPVTARDFEYAWKRVLDPKTASKTASWLAGFIKGGQAYNSSTAKDDQTALREAVGVKALDDVTLQVTLEAPQPLFHALTAYQAFSPVPRHVVEQHGDAWVKPAHIVSNGPWKTVEWKSKQRITLEKNAHYWGAANLPFDTIVYHITQEAEPAHNLYLAGEIDFLQGKIPPSSLPKYIEEKRPDLKVSPYVGVYQFLFNTQVPPLNDKRVRHALNMAINKAEVGKYVVKGNQPPATSIVHPALEHMGYAPVAGAGFDPDKARALLAEAGFPDGKGFPRLKLSYNTLERHKLVAQYLQEQWRKHLNINIELENMEWKVLMSRQRQLDFHISLGGWVGNAFDPLAFLVLWEGDSSFNRVKWRNADYDAHIAEARQAHTLESRNAALRKAEQVWVDELPAMPVYFLNNYDLAQPWLDGYQAHITGTHLSRYFKVKQ